MNDRGSRKKPRLSHLSLQRPCPMKGKNLIELASHRLADILTELSQDIMLQLAMHSRFSLSPQEWEVVSKDYGHATAALRAGLEVKFDWIKRAPWSLAGLANPDPLVSRRTGAEAMRWYDAQTQASHR